MTMRAPTDRAAAWAPWRRMLAGERVAISDTPFCGWYRAKRRGQYVAVQIDLIQDVCPDTGELVSDERFVAFVGGDVFYDQERVADVWMRCLGAIGEAEAERLLRMPAVSDLSRQVIV